MCCKCVLEKKKKKKGKPDHGRCGGFFFPSKEEMMLLFFFVYSLNTTHVSLLISFFFSRLQFSPFGCSLGLRRKEVITPLFFFFLRKEESASRLSQTQTRHTLAHAGTQTQENKGQEDAPAYSGASHCRWCCCRRCNT